MEPWWEKVQQKKVPRTFVDEPARLLPASTHLMTIDIRLWFLCIYLISTGFADVNNWRWQLDPPQQDLQTDSLINFTLTSAYSTVQLIIDDNVTYAVLLNCHDQIYYISPPFSAFVKNYTNFVQFWEPFQVNVSLLEPTTNQSVQNQTLIFSEQSSLYGVAVGTLFGVVGIYEHTFFETLQCYVTNTSGAVASYLGNVQQLEGNRYSCALFLMGSFAAGTPLQLSLDLEVSFLANSNIPGNASLQVGSSWTDMTTPNILFHCNRRNNAVTVNGNFYADRYYACSFCWDSKNNTAHLSAWTRAGAGAGAGGGAINCSFTGAMPDPNTASLCLCGLMEARSPDGTGAVMVYTDVAVAACQLVVWVDCPARGLAGLLPLVFALPGLLIAVLVLVYLWRRWGTHDQLERVPLRTPAPTADA